MNEEKEEIFNLKNVEKSLNESEIFFDSDNGDRLYQSFFLGTVMAIMPSGKYYMPWACSNVTEEEALQDEEYREQMEEELSSVNAYVVSGEGDPCDMLIERTYANLLEVVGCPSNDKWCSPELVEVCEEEKVALFKCKHGEQKIEYVRE